MPRMIEVLDPVGVNKAVQLKPSPRVADLNGRVIGLLDNSKPNFNLILERVEELLDQRFKVAQFVKRRKRWNSAGATSDMIQEMAEKCDLIVNGLGD